MEDVRLTFTKEAIQAIAAKAITRKTGARGLRAILETTLLDVMFDIPAQSDVREVVINKEAIENKAEPLLIYEEPPLEAQA
jgi:ATP-dependent Clp protease ATP-binding subunit ClpX